MGIQLKQCSYIILDNKQYLQLDEGYKWVRTKEEATLFPRNAAETIIDELKGRRPIFSVEMEEFQKNNQYVRKKVEELPVFVLKDLLIRIWSIPCDTLIQLAHWIEYKEHQRDLKKRHKKVFNDG